MAFTRAWRNFKRMQDTTVMAASLIYAAGVVGRAWTGCRAGRRSVLRWTLLWPAAYLLALADRPAADPGR